MILKDKLYRVPLAYIKKERYTGSYEGMRYMLEKKDVKPEEKKSEQFKKDVKPEEKKSEPFKRS